jgi:hypothetical protein
MNNETVSFEKVNGKRIFCQFAEPEPLSKKIIIMNHGFRGTNTGPARTFVDFSRFLNTNGFSTLRFDQPNSGNSEGDFLGSSFNEWVNTTEYFACKYLNLGYKVGLMGQSMGASTVVVATSRQSLKDRIPFILLWVPDPKSNFSSENNEIDEEEGQVYRNSFWQEAHDADFFKCLDEYRGAIHLVYGESDKFVYQELRDQVIEKIIEKRQIHMILAGQDHSPWKHDLCQEVYKKELELIKNNT